MDLRQHLKGLEKRFDQLLAELSAPDAAANSQRFQELSREHARLAPVIDTYHAYERTFQEEQDLLTLMQGSDAEMRKLAEDDLARMRDRKKTLEGELQMALIPRDPNEDRNIFWKFEPEQVAMKPLFFFGALADVFPLRGNPSPEIGNYVVESVRAGGIKEVIVTISGPQVWNQFKYESGVHRVQRVPATEASGRIHTSTPPSPCCRKPKMWTSRWIPVICGSIPTGLPGPADSTSTKPTVPSGSRIFPQAWWSPARRSAARLRTVPAR